MSASADYTDCITNSKECGSDDPEESEIEEWIVFFESEISYDKIFEFETDIPAEKHYHTHKYNKQTFEQMSIE